MPLIAHALFYAAYAMVSFALGLALVRVGDADAASATLGALCMFTAFAITHAGLNAASAAGAAKGIEKRLKKEFTAEIERVTAVQRRISDETSALGDQVARLDHAMSERPRQEAPSAIGGGVGGEAALIDQLAAKLGQVMDQRLEQVRRVTGPEPAPYARITRSPIDIVRDALSENRVELYLQPIVSLPQRRTAFYEGFTRLKDETGRIILPNEFMPAAEQAGLTSAIDNMLLFRCVQIVRKLAKQDRRIGIFCNISPRSLADEIFFPQFLEFMRENSDLAGALIFEVGQEEFDARRAMEARAIAKLTDLGFRFSIDKVKKLDVDLIDLERSGVRFVKASGTLLVEQFMRQGARPKSNLLREISHRDVAAIFRRHGIDLIAERVEHEATVVDVLELDTPYAQGHLFGAPRAIKDSLMSETAPPPGFMQHRAAG
jgi:cyclic-di-GMP phosphodiesterase TipF (flagellum assembly factor)